MTNEEIKETILKRIKEFQSGPVDINEKIENCSIDSLDLVELVTDAEEEFEVEITDEELLKIVTIKDIITLFQEKLNK
ncbi:MAG: phosphopantetheine-binding protein [Mycoplasma sp.]|nr:phosphopantetheine-binding protein [Mycoplasma sp.]